MAELKPCSACGNTKLVFNIHWPDYRRLNPSTMLLYGIVGDPEWRVACPRCGAYSAAARTKDEAIDEWNKMISVPTEKKGGKNMRYNCTCPEWEEHPCMNPNEGELECKDCCYGKEEEE